jgi:multiple sugar transport system permease protein
VDGASAWQRFWHITMPLLKPAILVALLFRTVDALRVYDLPQVMTQGAFGTESLSILVQRFVVQTPDPGFGAGAVHADVHPRARRRRDLRATARRTSSSVRRSSDVDTTRTNGRSQKRDKSRPTKNRRSKAIVERRSLALRWGKTAMLGVIFVWCLFPFVWLINTSLKEGDRALNSPNLFQGPFGLQNYVAVFQQDFHLNLRNSFIVAGPRPILCVVIGSLTGVRPRPPPAEAEGDPAVRRAGRVTVPAGGAGAAAVRAVARLGLLNTYPGLFIPYTAFTLPLTIFILTTFFASIPKDLEEAARVDGATPFKAFWRVVMPLAAPGCSPRRSSSSSVVERVPAGEHVRPPEHLGAQTVPVAIAAFTGAVQFQRPIGTITAACVIVTIPMIILALIFQKRIVAGLTAGGVKG